MNVKYKGKYEKHKLMFRWTVYVLIKSNHSVANCVRMTCSLPAAVPQMMTCLIKLMKHTVTCSLLWF